MSAPPSPPYVRDVPTPDGLRLHVRMRGEGGSVLLVPSESWMGADLEPLAVGRRIVGYDLRGRGRSSAVLGEAGLGFDRDLADLGTVRRVLGIERASLLGWSYHGAIAARHALDHRESVERLVLVGPAAPRAHPWFPEFLNRFARMVSPSEIGRLERWRREGRKERDPEAWCRAVHGLFFRTYVADPSCLERMRSSPCVEPNLDADRVNDQGRRVIERMGSYDWSEDFRGLDVPTLVVHGTEDPVPIEGSEEWVRILPEARLLPMEGVGHMPWLERPDEFFPAVERFLGGEWPV